jgi:hypothetical protein
MPGPQDGDIVIRQEMRDGTPAFMLRTVPGADQVVLRTRDAAMAQATAFARRYGVRVWLTIGESDFKLVEDFRVASV